MSYLIEPIGAGIFEGDRSPLDQPKTRAVVDDKLVSTRVGSVSIEDRINERSTADFDAHFGSSDNTSLKEAEPVTLTNRYYHVIFRGFIDEVEETRLNDDGDRMVSVRLMDNHYLADKRLVSRGFDDTTAGSIVETIIDENLLEENVEKGTIEDGVDVVEAGFNFQQASKVISELAEQCDFWWYIDKKRFLHFCSRTTFTFNTTITGDNTQHGTTSVQHGNQRYRNRQIITGAIEPTNTIEEFPTTDGDTRVWPLEFSVLEEPTVEVNSTEQSVGLKRGDTGDYRWAKGDNTIAQASGLTELTESDTLKVTYVGILELTVERTDNVEKTDRANLEETSGVVEQKLKDESLESLEAAQNVADRKLDHFAREGKQFRFETRTSGLHPGMLIPVDIPELSLDGDFLVEAVRSLDTAAPQDEEQGMDLAQWEIEAIQGPISKSWTDLFEQLGSETDKIAISDVARRTFTFSTTFIESDDPNPFITNFEGERELPFTLAFKKEWRVTHCALLDGSDNVLARRPITSSNNMNTDSAGDTYTVITNFPAGEGSGQVEKVEFYAGVEASRGPGTGITIDSFTSISTEKTDLEEFQIILNHTKDSGWT